LGACEFLREFFLNSQGLILTYALRQIPFLSHYHPSVSLQATELLSLNLPISGSSDISQNTLISFLDRFVYRNPKKHAMAKGASIMQPAAVSNGAGLTIVKHRGPRVGGDDAVGAGYVNDEKFWNKKVQDVPADQVS
jgi:ribosome biogenesis protein MAK21